MDGAAITRLGLVVHPSRVLSAALETIERGGRDAGDGRRVRQPRRAHRGRCPPLVAGAESRLSIELYPGSGGTRIELDGRVEARVDPHAPCTLDVGLRRPRRPRIRRR